MRCNFYKKGTEFCKYTLKSLEIFENKEQIYLQDNYMNSDGILIIARSHLPNVFNLMMLAAVIFFASFIWAMLPEKFRMLNQWGRNILKQAPSIMTALGLFGTFYGLTDSLRGFGTEIEQIQLFVNELKSVFVYSILGIASAAIFMVLNVAVNVIYHHRSQIEKNKAIQQYKQQNKQVQQNNEAVLQFLSAQLNATNQINKTLQNQNIGQDSVPAANPIGVSAEMQHYLAQQAQFAPHLAELSGIQETLNKTISKLLIPMKNHSAEFHDHMMSMFHEKMDAQTQLLAKISHQLTEQNQLNRQIIEKWQINHVPQSPLPAPDKPITTTSSALDPFKKLEQELEELSNENKKLFSNKFL